MKQNALGAWITNQTDAPFYARKAFRIEKELQKAVIQICGLGQFILSVNGKKVGDHELDPGWTDYRKYIEYVVFDLTSYLQPGDNVLGVEVGNGWFIKTDEHYTFRFPEFMPPNPNPYQPFGRFLMLSLALKLVYKDGSAEQIHADDSFWVKEHPTVKSNVYGSETIDGRLVQQAWNTIGFSKEEFLAALGWKHASLVAEADLPCGSLVEQCHPAVKVIHTYEGRCISDGLDRKQAKADTVSAPIREVYDFGQNMSGILEWEVYGRAGDIIRMYPAEKLGADGEIDQMAKGWTKVDSCITYRIGKDEEWESVRMKFTYFAGRYVAVEKEEEPGTKQIQIRNLKAHAISSAYETQGSFSCDDKRYEQIYRLVERAVEANLLSVHTDCPTIERFAWQEPNHLMAPSVFYMKHGQKLWEKFFLDMRAAQHTAEDYFYDRDGKRWYPGDGLIPSQCPCYLPNVLPMPGMGSFYDIVPWGSSIILAVYWHYVFYGDKHVIEANYEAGRRYLAHLKTKRTEEGFLCHGLGDWGNPKQELARENVETAFLYADTVTLAKFAGLLGKQEEEEELLEYAAEVREQYNKRLLVWHPKKGFWCYRVWEHSEDVVLTQAAEALPLYWGMVPPEREADVVAALRDTLEEEDAFISGEIGLPYIIQSARRYGMNDLISRFILRPEHPSYYAFILEGETTLGEYWETNPRSHCHDMMGHIIEWYYNGIAGILPEEPGFRRVTIRPYLPETMKQFTCCYQSASGQIQVRVEEGEKEILLTVEAEPSIGCFVDTGNLEEKGKPVNVKGCFTCDGRDRKKER